MKLKAGIFLDIENLIRSGGYGMRFKVIRQLVEAQDTVILRANAYLAINKAQEEADYEIHKRRERYRETARREGFHIVLKDVKIFTNEDGMSVYKANSDMDLAVDAILQSVNLDYVLLGSGDGDFIRVVRALQDTGRRVDLLSFDNTSGELVKEVDHHFNGFLVPGLVGPAENGTNRFRGYLHNCVAEKGYGFLTSQVGLKRSDARDDIFLHIRSITNRAGMPVSNEEFQTFEQTRTIIEFELGFKDGRAIAINANEFTLNDR